MADQPQTPLARKTSTIRSHSPYSPEKGPIVNHGFVKSRVQAIEKGFPQANVPPQYPRSTDDSLTSKHTQDNGVRAMKESPSFQRFTKQSKAEASTSHDSDLSRDAQPCNRRWEHSTSGVGSPIVSLPTGLQASSKRRIQSMWDLHTRYSGSPHGGRKKYRDYSNLRRISDGTETARPDIISPQPLSPYKQPISISQRTTEDDELGTARKDEQQHDIPPSVRRKSIAEELGNMVDVSEGQNEASVAWASENKNPEYPFPATIPVKDHSMSEAQRSDGGVSFDRKAYSQYVARSLPGLQQRRTASDSNDADDELRIKKVRSRHAAPENTMESVPESDEQHGPESLAPPRRILRAATMSYPIERSMSNIPRRATLPVLNTDPFNDQSSYEDIHAGPGTSQYTVTPGDAEDLRSIAEDLAKPRDGLEIQRVGNIETLHSRRSSAHSRRSSATSRASSTAPSRSLSRVWRRISTWRLGFGANRAESFEPSLDKKQEVETQGLMGSNMQSQHEELSADQRHQVRSIVGEHAPDLSSKVSPRAEKDPYEDMETLANQGLQPPHQSAVGIQPQKEGVSKNGGRQLENLGRERVSNLSKESGAGLDKDPDISPERQSSQGLQVPRKTGAEVRPQEDDVSEDEHRHRKHRTSESSPDRSTKSGATASEESDTETEQHSHRGPQTKNLNSRPSTASNEEDTNFESRQPVEKSEDSSGGTRSPAQQAGSSSPQAGLTERSVKSRDQALQPVHDKRPTGASTPPNSSPTPRNLLTSSSAFLPLTPQTQGTKSAKHEKGQQMVLSSGSKEQGMKGAWTEEPQQSILPLRPREQGMKGAGTEEAQQITDNAAYSFSRSPLDPPHSPQPVLLDSLHIDPAKSRTLDEQLNRDGRPTYGIQSSSSEANNPVQATSYPARSSAAFSDERPLLSRHSSLSQDTDPSLSLSAPVDALPVPSKQRPRLSATGSHASQRATSYTSLKPRHGLPTTGLSTPEPINWTSNTLHSCEGEASKSYTSLTDRYRVHSGTHSTADRHQLHAGTHVTSDGHHFFAGAHSAAERYPVHVGNHSTTDGHHVYGATDSAADRYQAHTSTHTPANNARPPSPAPSETETVGSTVSAGSTYLSLKSSQASLRPSLAGREPATPVLECEPPRCRDRDQRIKRVKVVVSLDGGPDLVVDAIVEEGRSGDGAGGWRVREEIREWRLRGEQN